MPTTTAVEVLHDDGRWYLAQLLGQHRDWAAGGWRCGVRYTVDVRMQYQRVVWAEQLKAATKIATFTYEELYGGDGNDRIDGGAGYDDIYGGAGDDVLGSFFGPVTTQSPRSEAEYPRHEYVSGEDAAPRSISG